MQYSGLTSATVFQSISNYLEKRHSVLKLFHSLIHHNSYSYLDVEIVAISAGEAENPRKIIPKAIKRVFYRILLFYVGGIMVIGLLVPSNAPGLFSEKGKGTANTSPFVIAINNAGIGVLPDVVNAVILVAAYSAANTDLHSGSRVLHVVACRGMAPSIFARCTKSGQPLFAILPTAAGGLLAFLRLNHSGATVFRWLSRISSITGLFAWFTILLSYTRFYQGLKHDGLDRNKIPYKSPLQPYLSYFGLGMVTLVILFSGFDVFLKDNWSAANFVTSYIGLVAYFFLYFYWKVARRSKFVQVPQTDFVTGTKLLNEMDIYYAENENQPNTPLKKLWN